MSNQTTTPDELVKIAVQDIVAGINSGLDPQKAAVKTASELKLNHNFIKRASEAVNVALHHSHFKSNPDDKAAEFPTIDAQKVAEEIYGAKEKTAGEFESEKFSSFQYQEVTPKFARYLEDGPHKEAYIKILEDSDTLSKYAMSERGTYEKGSKYLLRLKKLAEDKTAEADEARYQINKNFCSILSKFAEDPATRSSWDAFETSVFSSHGEMSNEYLDLLYKTAKLNEERGKHDPAIKLAGCCPELALFDKFLASIELFKRAGLEASDAAHNLKFEQDYIKDAFETRGCELNKLAGLEDTSSLISRVEQSLKAEKVKLASADMTDPVLEVIAEKKALEIDLFENQITKLAAGLFESITGAAGKAYDANSKPGLSASTNTPENNRERALLLQELISTDPIISKLPINQTVNAYQQMLRLAPELSREKEVTRAFLRQAGASQALAPFEAEQLVDANTRLFKQHQLQQGTSPTPSDSKN